MHRQLGVNTRNHGKIENPSAILHKNQKSSGIIFEYPGVLFTNAHNGGQNTKNEQIVDKVLRGIV
jgi:hypothetical protein